MMNCQLAHKQIHQYLDGTISVDEEQLMRVHLSQCGVCHQHLLDLEKTIALVQSLSHIQTKEDFTDRLLAKLPKEKRNKTMGLWMKKHPLMVAASLFILLMFGSSALTWYSGDKHLQISSQSSNSLIVEEGYVYVPADQVLEGDLIVQHGDIKIDGEVRGNVIAIDGAVLLSSTAHITGKTEEVNEMLEWFWYKIKTFARQVVTP